MVLLPTRKERDLPPSVETESRTKVKSVTMETVKVEMVAMLLVRSKASGGDVLRTKLRSLLASSSVEMENSSHSMERSVMTATVKVVMAVLHTASLTQAGSVKAREVLLKSVRESVETESSTSV